MQLKQTRVWQGLSREDWLKKINHALGPNLTIVHTQGPDHPDHDNDPKKRERLVTNARLHMIGELSEIVWQMHENELEDPACQVEDILDCTIGFDVTDREVRMHIQNLVDDLDFFD